MQTSEPWGFDTTLARESNIEMHTNVLYRGEEPVSSKDGKGSVSLSPSSLKQSTVKSNLISTRELLVRLFICASSISTLWLSSLGGAQASVEFLVKHGLGVDTIIPTKEGLFEHYDALVNLTLNEGTGFERCVGHHDNSCNASFFRFQDYELQRSQRVSDANTRRLERAADRAITCRRLTSIVISWMQKMKQNNRTNFFSSTCGNMEALSIMQELQTSEG